MLEPGEGGKGEEEGERERKRESTKRETESGSGNKDQERARTHMTGYHHYWTWARHHQIASSKDRDWRRWERERQEV